MSIPLDGNVMVGALEELFSFDVSVAVVECAGCGHSGAVAAVVVYTDAPGMVARCPGCTDVLFRLVRAPDRVWLDMRGSLCLRVDMPDA
jgi:ribosomal protein S27E